MKDEKELKIKVAEAAKKAFNEKGVKFRMDDVANMLQMSKKTLYKLYDSKEKLILKAVDLGFGAVMENKQAIIDDPDLDMVEKIRRVIIAIPDRYQTMDWRRLYEFRDSFPEAYARIQFYLQNNWEGTIDLVKKGIEQGLIRDINITVFRCMLESAFQSFIGNTALIDAGVSYDDALNTMIDIVMTGIVTEKGAKSK
ncbi:MAG: TetR/AcrR family transcriptional regulator [Lachnospiraceae bacterium]|nr:TetR/AcrR family transcriptional regulator [Lachnospiraceae bacterium]